MINTKKNYFSETSVKEVQCKLGANIPLVAEKICKDFIELLNRKKYTSYEYVSEIKFWGFTLRNSKEIFTYTIDYENDYVKFFMGNDYHILENIWHTEFSKTVVRLIAASCTLARSEIMDILVSTYNVDVKILEVVPDSFYYDCTGRLCVKIRLEF